MPAGRPTKYDPAMCDVVMDAGAEGKTLAGMAEAINVDRETLNNWREAHPEFSRAVKRGLEKAQAWWEEQGRVATFGGCEGFNATSYIFQMKNRFRDEWNDTVKQDVTATHKHEGEGLSLLLSHLDAISSRTSGSASE